MFNILKKPTSSFSFDYDYTQDFKSRFFQIKDLYRNQYVYEPMHDIIELDISDDDVYKVIESAEIYLKKMQKLDVEARSPLPLGVRLNFYIMGLLEEYNIKDVTRRVDYVFECNYLSDIKKYTTDGKFNKAAYKRDRSKKVYKAAIEYLKKRKHKLLE